MLPPKEGSALKSVIWFPIPLLLMSFDPLIALFCAGVQFPAYGVAACILARRISWSRAMAFVLLFHLSWVAIAAAIVQKAL